MQSEYAGIQDWSIAGLSAVFTEIFFAIQHPHNKHVKPFILFSINIYSVFSLVFTCSILHSQVVNQDSIWINADWYYSSEETAFIDLTEFLPSVLRDDIHLKRYLRDDRFFALRRMYNDTLAVDAIFDRAMLLTNGNIRSALLLSTFAVMDHRSVGLKIPVIGSVYIPLTLENDSLFRLRRTHLPKRILDQNKTNDKDKLQHFFGSAYLAYLTRSQSFAAWVGDLMELGEDRFVLGGKSDVRDKLANEKGREFGLGLLDDPDLLPSDILWGNH